MTKRARARVLGIKKPTSPRWKKLSAGVSKHAEAMEIARRSFSKYADTYKALAK